MLSTKPGQDHFAASPISLYNPPYAGLAKYLDGLSIHPYYNAGCYPEQPPEQTIGTLDLPGAVPFVQDRHAMATLLHAHAKLIASESGVSYKGGYSPTYPSAEYLFEHGAIFVRSHLFLLGEGVDVTYFFFTADYPDEPGYGLYFNFNMTAAPYGSGSLSPKPAAMAAAALTRLLDGTVTLGPIKGLPTNAYGYAFQRLQGPVVTALWAHVDANYTVGAPGSNGTVTVIDEMGNAASVPFSDGRLSLTLGHAPQYVVSTDVAMITPQVTTPEGTPPAVHRFAPMPTSDRELKERRHSGDPPRLMS